MSTCPIIFVDTQKHLGEIDVRNHGMGFGLGPLPIPEVCVPVLKRLKPTTMRLFVLEYYKVYRGHGAYDWTSLDEAVAAYLRALRRAPRGV